LESFIVDEPRLTASFGQEIIGISVLFKTFQKFYRLYSASWFYLRLCIAVIFTIENENSHYSFVCCFTWDGKPTNYL